MSTVKFNCNISGSNPAVPLGLEIWIDDIKFFDQDCIDRVHEIEHEINDDDGDRNLRFVLKNKLPEHTKVDANGTILSDATLSINDIRFDDIDCQHMVCTLSKYHHDFNGSQNKIIDEFYGSMGCNGTVSLKFTTPIYLWLLEKM
jgi:hypothetical protein